MRGVPITLLTGFLGAGKSTLLANILQEEHGKKVAVIQNEANNLGLEQMTAVSEDGEQTQEWVDLPNGCVCCTVKDDLLVTLENLLKRQPFEHIVIEMSGLADPGPLIQIFWSDDELEAEVYLDAVVCVCDAQHIMDHLDKTTEAAQQIAMSDRVLLNKCDLVSEAEANRVVEALSAINGVTSVMRTVRSNANLEALLHINAFDAEKTAQRLREARGGEAAAAGGKGAHSKDIRTARVRVEGAMDKGALKRFLASVLWECDGTYDVLRVKGLIMYAGKKVKYALQGVREVWNIEKTRMPAGDEAPVSEFVFIGRELPLDKWEEDLRGCVVKK